MAKRGYPLTENYAREALLEANFKLLDAIKAVETDIGKREWSIAEGGSKRYAGFNPRYGMDAPAELFCSIAAERYEVEVPKTEWKRDQLLSWLECEEKLYEQFFSGAENWLDRYPDGDGPDEKFNEQVSCCSAWSCWGMERLWSIC